MWQIVRIGNESYYVDVQNDIRNRKVLVLTHVFGALWDAEVSYDEIGNEMNKLNEFLEFDEGELMSDIMDLFAAGRADVQWSIKREDVQLILHLTSTQENIEYSFKAILHPSDSFLNHRVLVLPLSTMVRVMAEEMKKKDNELLEHRMNGSVITRKSLETAVFNEKSFEVSPQSLNAILSNHSKDLFDTFMISYFNKIQPVIWEKLSENQPVKEESPTRPKRKLDNSGSAQVSQKVTSELVENKEEIIQNMTFHKMNSINSRKCKPTKKLKGL